jgi:predicted dehydrogenase
VILRVGLVGCGTAARHHVPALRAARGAELVAVFDVDSAAAAQTGAEVAPAAAAGRVASCSRTQRRSQRGDHGQR